MAIARHTLVWIDPSSCDDSCFVDEDDRDMALRWLKTHPAVVRHSVYQAEGTIALGIPFPGYERRRIAFTAPSEAFVKTSPMPLIHDAVASAPTGWRARLAGLDQRISAFGGTGRLYGSLGWQHITGETYLRAGSDIDLLVEPTSRFDLEAALRTFRDIVFEGPPRLDGELIVAFDRAVAWREFESSTQDILVRSQDNVQLVAKSDILAQLTQAART